MVGLKLIYVSQRGPEEISSVTTYVLFNINLMFKDAISTSYALPEKKSAPNSNGHLSAFNCYL